jgi:hypothetical protein
VQDEPPGAGERFEPIQDSDARAPAVNSHDPAAGRGAVREDVLEDGDLALPVRTELRRAVEADLADVAHLRQQFVEKGQLALALMRELRVQAERSSDSRRIARQRARALPGARRRRNGQDIEPALPALGDEAGGIGIEIEMAMKVDHRTPIASRNAPSS